MVSKLASHFKGQNHRKGVLFALAAAFALGIALLTISYHSIRASLSNPADSLRYE